MSGQAINQSNHHKDQGPCVKNSRHAKGVHDSASSSSSSGDDAVAKAMLMQLEELNVLTNAASEESAVSVALRNSMQQEATKYLEMLQKLLSFATNCEDNSDFSKLLRWGSSCSFSNLVKNCPGMGLSGIPSEFRDAFCDELKMFVFKGPDAQHLSTFRSNVGQTGSMINQASTVQTDCKNIADSYQNGSGSLTQSITQYLAQLSSEGSLMGAEISQ